MSSRFIKLQNFFIKKMFNESFYSGTKQRLSISILKWFFVVKKTKKYHNGQVRGDVIITKIEKANSRPIGKWEYKYKYLFFNYERIKKKKSWAVRKLKTVKIVHDWLNCEVLLLLSIFDLFFAIFYLQKSPRNNKIWLETDTCCVINWPHSSEYCSKMTSNTLYRLDVSRRRNMLWAKNDYISAIIHIFMLVQFFMKNSNNKIFLRQYRPIIHVFRTQSDI